ncbi:MAG: FUSC family protein [Methyloprofundus sp.]|nr:FUSC family protein [Methyloprofundus sp.]
MTLSFDAKESIKTALAMTISYGIALSQDWNSPLWAGFAVAFISLSTSGQSFNKSAMRMVGAFAAGAVSLTLIALFPQERWWFMAGLSLYVGGCTYMMSAAKYQYFWFSAGYVCIIVALEAGPNPVRAFDLAILRIQETALGVLVYSVITALLWRSNSLKKFKAVCKQLHTSQHQLYRHYFKLMQGDGDLTAARNLMAQAIQQQTQFQVLLLAAQTDSYEMGEFKQQWQDYQNQLGTLSIVLERWHDGFVSAKNVEIAEIIPKLNVFGREMEQRFILLMSLLDDSAPGYTVQATDLKLDENALNKLSHFQQAALHEIHKNLCQLEQLTHTLCQSLAAIKGFEEVVIIHSDATQTKATGIGAAIDIERLAGILQVMASLWLPYLAFIYVEALPGGIGVVIFAGVLGMQLSVHPNIPVMSLVAPLMSSIVLCGMVYIFWMSQLTSFVGLGIMIFVVTFIICYLYASPQKGLGRAAGLVMFVTVTGVNNQQTYNVLSVYNTALAFLIILAVLFIVAYMPFSPRPERAYTRLLSRFFRRSEFLMMSQLSGEQRKLSFWAKIKHDFYFQDLKTLPNKIELRSRSINAEKIGTSKAQLQAMIADIQMISLRLQFLLEARASSQAEILIDELLADGHSWRNKLQETFQQLSKYPNLKNQSEWRTLMTATLDLFESRMTSTLNNIDNTQLSGADKENFYHLLGAYRGISDATLAYSSTAQLINWDQWYETRL